MLRRLLCMLATLGWLALPTLSARAGEVAGAGKGADPAKAPVDAWLLFRGNDEMTGVTAATLPLNPRQLWFVETKDSIDATAAIANGAVFVPTMNGQFLALSLDDGKELWKYANENQDASRSSPCIAGELVLYGDEFGTFRALDAKTGELRWSFTCEGEIVSSPTVIDEKVIFGSYDETVYCLDVVSGKEIWRLRTEGPVHCSPSRVGKDVVIAGCDGFLRLVSTETGKETRSLNIGGNIASTPAVVGDSLYLGTMSNQVLRINTHSLERQWSYEHPKRNFPFYSSPAVARDTCFIGGRDKLLHALDCASGMPRWTHRTDGKVDSSPVVVDDRVFFGSMDGNLYAADLKTGQTRWQHPTGAPIAASPAVASNRLVIGTQDGTIYCFGLKDN